MSYLRPAIIALLALIVGLFLASVEAQTLLFTLDAPNPQSYLGFGTTVAMGDADGDGNADLLVGVPSEKVDYLTYVGRAYLFSGASGAAIHALDTPNPMGRPNFGKALAMGDADGDGRADLLVGAPGEDVGVTENQGRAYLFSGATGALIRILDSPNPQPTGQFGYTLASGDADGDGRADFLVGHAGEDVDGNTNQGRAYLFSGATGALLRTLDSPSSQAFVAFGHSLAMGEADGDGRADLLVGAPGEDVGVTENQGRAYLFSGVNGALIRTLDTPNPQASTVWGFGHPLAMGDADGDGRADILVGAQEEDVGPNTNQGRAYLFSGATGALLRTFDTPNPQANTTLVGFGSSLAVGDADDDGWADALVGASEEDVGANTDQGRAYLFSGATGALMDALDTPNPQPEALFGHSMAMGDANGDGRAELLVGAPFEGVGPNPRQGRAYVFSSSMPTPTPTPTPTATPTPTPSAVGGIVQFRTDAPSAPAASGSSATDHTLPIAAAVAGGALALVAGAWYSRRRRLR